jgi:TupA-like ATPgrasp
MEGGDMQVPSGLRALKRHFFRRSDGERILKDNYRSLSGHELDCDRPATFTAKLFQRMIWVNRRGHPVLTELSDKYRVRAFVSARLGEHYLVKLLWHGDDAHDIPFDALPHSYAIKTNHGSGGHVFVRGIPDRQQIVEHFSAALRESYYWRQREYHYHAIPPRILIEEMLDDGEPSGPLDYRFWCFNGVPAVIQVDNSSHTINPFYNTRWHALELRYRTQVEQLPIARPRNLEKMLGAAATLAEGFDFVRVDLYNIQGRICFGEMSFTPRGGFLKFQPPEWDLILGQLWTVEPLPRDWRAQPATGSSVQ